MTNMPGHGSPRLAPTNNGPGFPSAVVHGTISNDTTDSAKQQRLFALTKDDDVAADERTDVAMASLRRMTKPMLPMTIPKPVSDDETDDETNNETDDDHPTGLFRSNPTPESDKVLASLKEKIASIPGLDLSGDAIHSRVINYLVTELIQHMVKNDMLEKELAAANETPPKGENTESLSAEATPSKDVSEIFHAVCCQTRPVGSEPDYYQDVPRMFKGDRRTDHLRGLLGIENLSEHMEDHLHIVFAIIYEYNCSCNFGSDHHRVVGCKDGKLIKDSPPAETKKASIRIGSSVQSALKAIMKAHPQRFEGFSAEHLPDAFREPYILFYNCNDTFLDLVDTSGLEESSCNQVRMLCNWFEANRRADWDEADELFSQKKVNAKHYAKLFKPGELLVDFRNDKGGLIYVLKVQEYPWRNDHIEIACSWWGFNGAFRKFMASHSLKVMEHRSSTSALENIATIYNPPESANFCVRDGEKDITSLGFYPLRFADEGLREKLVARGHKFWQCRKTRLVSYVDADEERYAFKQSEQRFMIDYNIFRRLHPEKAIFRDAVGRLDPSVMANDEPPNDGVLAMMPPEIHGFDLATKAWRLLQVDRITDVTWNKDAFKRLVAPAETKELIEAAVTAHGNQLSAAPDIIGGKGHGLLVLLHGGPGTGKTLTAESIAEAQERPLYRVTCGDIGIQPAEVEQYLRSVLIIGKAWGCVVLLDEADVFLEERTVQDQKQNAIVSVFLRALEYYDGIMILTSNRVGTFDEAFKSRIHLAIRYEILDEEQRAEIWRNFIDMLRNTKERVDIEDLEMNVNKLARFDMNGRQIRNVITMARYLAKYRKQMLVYKHVQDAVSSVVKFEEYLHKLRGSDENWARESKVR